MNYQDTYHIVLGPTTERAYLPNLVVSSAKRSISLSGFQAPPFYLLSTFCLPILCFSCT